MQVRTHLGFDLWAETRYNGGKLNLENPTMKHIFVILGCAALACGASADRSKPASSSEAGIPVRNSFVTRAKVVNTKPVVETVLESYDECGYVTRTKRPSSRKRSNAGTNTGERIVGGLVGGAVGGSLGSGRGSDALAAGGAVIGSEVADGDGLTGGEVVGGVVGGVIGNQFGSGSGRTAATGAGALIGAIVGDNIQSGMNDKPREAAGPPQQTKERVCKKKQREKKVITGYEVVFEYAGFQQTGVLPYQPGEHVDINVNVDLLEDRTSRVGD